MQKLISVILQNDGVQGIEKYIKDELRFTHRGYFIFICLLVTIFIGIFINQSEQYSNELNSFKDKVFSRDSIMMDSVKNYVEVNCGSVVIQR